MRAFGISARGERRRGSLSPLVLVPFLLGSPGGCDVYPICFQVESEKNLYEERGGGEVRAATEQEIVGYNSSFPLITRGLGKVDCCKPLLYFSLPSLPPSCSFTSHFHLAVLMTPKKKDSDEEKQIHPLMAESS